ncbi:MAG: MBL fold metallo-hydrolase [Candidatus Bathyarchaeia archaeon]
MPSIRVRPIAFESMGVRSMCTLVESPDVKVLIDPGLSLGPRFSLIPHPEEYRARSRLRRRLLEAAGEAEILAVTHYHYDHYTPFFDESVWTGSTVEEAEMLYQGKDVLAKSYRGKVNLSQRRRGWLFWRSLSERGINAREADGSTFTFGETKLIFSEPVPHGEQDSILGWVLMLLIERGGERILFTSDIQGPMAAPTMKLIEAWNPQLAIIGGPPIYLRGYRVSDEAIGKALNNMLSLTGFIPLIIVDHHLLRDPGWTDFLDPVFKAAEANGGIVHTAASFSGSPVTPLEYKRKDLYASEPPSREFSEWIKLPEDSRRRTPPPIQP